MPVVNRTQARVDLTVPQAVAINNLTSQLAGDEQRPVVGFGIEETNLRDTVALMTAEVKNRVFMIAPDGDVHELGNPD